MSVGDLVLTIEPDFERAVRSLRTAATAASTAFGRFAAAVLSDPVALAAFLHAQKSPSPLRGGHGAEYHRRTRSRTRSRR